MYKIYFSRLNAAAFGVDAWEEHPSLPEAESRAAALIEAGFGVRVVPSALPPPGAAYWVAIGSPEGWLQGAAGSWLDVVGAARRRVLGAGRTWRVRRADGTLAWEGPAVSMPATEPEATQPG